MILAYPNRLTNKNDNSLLIVGRIVRFLLQLGNPLNTRRFHVHKIEKSDACATTQNMMFLAKVIIDVRNSQ